MQLQLYGALSKARLSFWVAISACLGYVWVAPEGVFSLSLLAAVFTGGFLVAASSSTWNQYIEVRTDAKMRRTANRPLPTQSISRAYAQIFGWSSGIIGLVILHQGANPMAAYLSLISLLLYVAVYTPLKRHGVISVFIGAIPGALPPLIGCVAAQGHISTEAILLFSLQFAWQFPHFWLIAWIANEDYRKVGFYLLPTAGITNRTPWIIVGCTAALVPIGYIPTYVGIVSAWAGNSTVLIGMGLLVITLPIVQKATRQKLLRGLWAGLFYLPVVQTIYVVDRWWK